MPSRKSSGALLRLDVDFKRIAKIKSALQAFPGIVEDEFAQAMDTLAKAIMKRARELAPNVSGALRRSIQFTVKSWAEAYIGSSSDYASYVEFGTRPHGLPQDDNAPELRSFKEWCGKKGIPMDAMRKYILGHGTDPHPYLEPAYIYGQKLATHLFNKAMGRACRRMQAMANA